MFEYNVNNWGDYSETETESDVSQSKSIKVTYPNVITQHNPIKKTDSSFDKILEAKVLNEKSSHILQKNNQKWKRNQNMDFHHEEQNNNFKPKFFNNEVIIKKTWERNSSPYNNKEKSKSIQSKSSKDTIIHTENIKIPSLPLNTSLSWSSIVKSTS
jgi:hypothetical protein